MKWVDRINNGKDREQNLRSDWTSLLYHHRVKFSNALENQSWCKG